MTVLATLCSGIFFIEFKVAYLDGIFNDLHLSYKSFAINSAFPVWEPYKI